MKSVNGADTGGEKQNRRGKPMCVQSETMGLIYKNVLRFIFELSLKIISNGVLAFDS